MISCREACALTYFLVRAKVTNRDAKESKSAPYMRKPCQLCQYI